MKDSRPFQGAKHSIMDEQPSFPNINHLLHSLPPEIYTALQPSLEKISLTFKEVLYDVNASIPFVYFPLTGVNSLLTVMQDGTAVEGATVGNEGMVGLPVFLGGDTIPGRAIAQVPGDALRMPSDVFRAAVERYAPLRNILDTYTQALFVLVSQSAACNRVHSIEQRCARWLLMTQDRVGNQRFSLTQEFLSQMLGVRRASVSEIASQLQQEGLIGYSRGEMTILDRQGLEARSCECYWIVRREFERTLGWNQVLVWSPGCNKPGCNK